MANYWIKLYIEIIDDPKMATLPDRLWRRVVELFLLAGKFGEEGLLPNTRSLAWMLRMETDQLEDDITQLLNTGIVEAVPNGWKVAKFAERQAPVPGKERVKQFRERKQHEQYNGIVTGVKRSVTQINRLTETEKNPATANRDELQKHFLIETHLPAPKYSTEKLAKKAQVLWWTPLTEILEFCGGDLTKAKELVTRTVKDMRKDSLTLSDPNSILKTAKSLYAEAQTPGRVFNEEY